jgi:hypothetical protein
VTSTDLHLGYSRSISGYKVNAFCDIINAFNQEQSAGVDELYTYDNANPIVGGSQTDLPFAKRLDGNGAETGQPLGRNIGFDKPVSRYRPLYLRIGLRVSF